MSNLLQRFYTQTETRDAVYEYLMASLCDYGGELALSGKDTSGISKAKEAIDYAFNEMEAEFKPKLNTTPLNHAQ